jgi:hypothetical protein
VKKNHKLLTPKEQRQQISGVPFTQRQLFNIAYREARRVIKRIAAYDVEKEAYKTELAKYALPCDIPASLIAPEYDHKPHLKHVAEMRNLCIDQRLYALAEDTCLAYHYRQPQSMYHSESWGYSLKYRNQPDKWGVAKAMFPHLLKEMYHGTNWFRKYLNGEIITLQYRQQLKGIFK